MSPPLLPMPMLLRQTKEHRVRDCGGSNKTGSYRPIGRGAIRRRGLVGVGVALLEEVCHFGDEL